MPTNPWVSPANNTSWSSGAAGTTLATAATLAISPSTTTAPDYTLAGGVLYPGMVIRFTAAGIWTCGSTATNATFALMYGGTGGTVLATSGAVAMLASQTHVSWYINAILSCRSAGSSGTVWTTGQASGIVAAAPMSDSRMDSAVFGTPAVATINTTTASALVLNGTLSQITGSPTITCEQWLIELIG
jgi:hypothetical protein